MDTPATSPDGAPDPDPAAPSRRARRAGLRMVRRAGARVVRGAGRRARRRPVAAAVSLSACLVTGLLGGVVAMASQAPEASRLAVTGLVDRHLGPQAVDTVREVVEAASGAGRQTPPEPLKEAEQASDRGAVLAAEAPEPGPVPSGSGIEPPARRAVLALEKSPPPAPSPSPTAEPGSGLLGRMVEPALSGELVVAAGSVPAPGQGTVLTVRVEVEKGLPVDLAVFAEAVLTTLNDPRGWSGVDGVTFARTDGETPDVGVILSSPATTDALCAPLDTAGELSCGTTSAAILNFDRWVNGAEAFGPDAVAYRQYLVNHEVGHVLGHHHDECPAPGALAPVMVQQTLSTQGCLPNGWPRP
ncbi:DUF3152 domain-containing protein [Antribacter sp. KLBMP9083]|uniref:DUF3152 domain-containing protein n=1 Tax=Antribacter soli TaxID=2910976 RepID=A0AA41QHC0_9MICO|nr:DUF3152 domain-containing protein [Antribacter soli]MCF4123498.1 DUF3152 domain-containing protein [Antribacter soli]